MEISAVPWYLGILFNPLLIKIKKSVFHDHQKGQNAHQKTIFFIFLNKLIQIVPKYSESADISKTVARLVIGVKLFS